MDVREGGVEISVPEQEEGHGENVFFNPVQELNRDLTIAVLRAYREREPRAKTYLDGMTASGIRGIRAAADGWDVTCCDVDADAVDLCQQNLERNDLEASVRHQDTNSLLHETYFDVVDIDPFGTPIPFVDAAFRGTRNLLCVTATDTAPLCGAHFESGVRSYSAVPRNTEYHQEMGVRILLSALIRTGVSYDIAPRPLLTHATKHYVRTYLELERGATEANEAIEELGYIHHCQHCLKRTTETGLIANPPEKCPNCEHGIQTAGPVYLGPTADVDFVGRVDDEIDETLGTAENATSLLERLWAELPVPTHYDQHKLCKRWGRPAPKMSTFLDALREAGYDVSRTHYGGTTFKTNASVEEIRDVTGSD
jgi:tRNA (guanine26-N2/guanine27-N2)-dimethyltransferase